MQAKSIGYVILNGHKPERHDHKGVNLTQRGVGMLIDLLEDKHNLAYKNRILKAQYESEGRDDWYKDRYRIKLALVKPPGCKIHT